MNALTIPGPVPLAAIDHGGDGDPVVFLHGAGRTAEDAALLVSRLPDHRVVAVDLRGHGRSGDGPWAWEELVADVERVVSHLGLTRPILLGHSLGGMIAVTAASQIDGVAGVVNLDGFGAGKPEHHDGLDPKSVAARQAELRRGVVAAVRASALATPPLPVLEEAVRTAAASHDLDADQMVRALRRGAREDGGGQVAMRPDPDTFEAVLDLTDSFDIGTAFDAAGCPVHVIISTAAIDAADTLGMPRAEELHDAYRRGLRRHMAALSNRLPLLSVELLAHPHSSLLSVPDIVAGRLVAAFAQFDRVMTG